MQVVRIEARRSAHRSVAEELQDDVTIEEGRLEAEPREEGRGKKR